MVLYGNPISVWRILKLFLGPMDSKRIIEITDMTKNVLTGKIFVTAFLDF